MKKSKKDEELNNTETVESKNINGEKNDSNDEKLKDESVTNEKVKNILQKAKEKGEITYGELATELGDINPDQIDKVFDAFEEFGVDVLKDDIDEPDYRRLTRS